MPFRPKVARLSSVGGVSASNFDEIKPQSAFTVWTRRTSRPHPTAARFRFVARNGHAPLLNNNRNLANRDADGGEWENCGLASDGLQPQDLAVAAVGQDVDKAVRADAYVADPLIQFSEQYLLLHDPVPVEFQAAQMRVRERADE